MSVRVNQFQPQILFREKDKPVQQVEEERISGVKAGEKAPDAKEITDVGDYLDGLENNTQNSTIIYKGFIFRDNDECLVVPEDVYNAIKSYNGNDPYEFAKQVAGDNADRDKINYYASWFMLIQQEGGINSCLPVSDIHDIQEMIQSGRFTMEEVTVKSDGQVTSKIIDNRSNVEKFNDTVDSATKELQEYKEQFKYYITTEDYERVKARLAELNEKVSAIFGSAVEELQGALDVKNSDNALLLSNIKNTYQIFNSTIKNTERGIDMTYQVSQTWGDTTPPEDDKNKSIDEIISEIEQEIKEMFSEISYIETESEYKEFQRKLACINERLYHAYVQELDIASSNNDFSSIQELDTKYNKGVEILNQADIVLEGLYANGDVESLQAGQEFSKLQSRALQLISKVENLYNLTYEECKEIMQELKEVEKQMGEIFALSIRRMDTKQADECQKDYKDMINKMRIAYKKLDSLDEVLPSVTENDRNSDFNEIIDSLISDLTEFDKLGYVSPKRYEILSQRLNDIHNRALFAFFREIEWAGENPIGEIMNTYNDFMDNYYSKAEKKLENAHKRSQGLGKFNSILLNNRIK